MRSSGRSWNKAIALFRDLSRLDAVSAALRLQDNAVWNTRVGGAATSRALGTISLTYHLIRGFLRALSPVTCLCGPAICGSLRDEIQLL